MLATMATLMMPAPTPSMTLNQGGLPFAPPKQHEMLQKAIPQHTVSAGQKPGKSLNVLLLS